MMITPSVPITEISVNLKFVSPKPEVVGVSLGDVVVEGVVVVVVVCEVGVGVVVVGGGGSYSASKNSILSTEKLKASRPPRKSGSV